MPKPNILIIVADDLGVDVLRVANGEVAAEIGVSAIAKSAGPLPTLGKLLKSGIHFATAWAQPVCSPTRASLFTANGKFALRGDNGNYLARCYGCVPGAAYPDGAFLHIGKDQVNALTGPSSSSESVFIRRCERIGAREADGSVLYDRRTDLRSSLIHTL
ncbi:MAG TPA: sulfatase-like hydrolase/transferase [Polyangium sp.]|nr:sulfatase-like hydrolase/transferase [Polyangium sp.]